MKVQSTGIDFPAERKSRSPLMILLVALNAFVLGGCLALLIVGRLLQEQRDLYVSLGNMPDASTIIDFMDDLLIVYMACGSAVLLLLLFSAVVWAWTKTESRFLRYGSILLLLTALVFLAGMWLLGSSSTP